jgi:hypothetical protein
VLQAWVPDSSRWRILRPIFDVDAETSIPTWFSSVQLFTVGLLLLVQSRQPSRRRLLLLVGALGFMFLSVDEGAAVHDRIYVIARNRPPFVGVQFLAWMVPYFFIAAVLVLVLAKPILLTYRRFRRESALAGAGATLFVTGGVVSRSSRTTCCTP